jgi:rod shape-determining protein MreD
VSGFNKFWPAALALIVATILQASIAPYMAIFGVAPNFILLVVVVLALLEGPVVGCTAGFFGGLALDLLGDSVVGPYALALTLVGYVAGLMEANMFAEGWLLPVTVVAVASLATELVYGIILAFLDVGSSFGTEFVRVMLPSALYNTALAVLLFPLLVRVLRRDTQVKSFKRLA